MGVLYLEFVYENPSFLCSVHSELIEAKAPSMPFIWASNLQRSIHKFINELSYKVILQHPLLRLRLSLSLLLLLRAPPFRAECNLLKTKWWSLMIVGNISAADTANLIECCGPGEPVRDSRNWPKGCCAGAGGEKFKWSCGRRNARGDRGGSHDRLSSMPWSVTWLAGTRPGCFYNHYQDRRREPLHFLFINWNLKLIKLSFCAFIQFITNMTPIIRNMFTN